MGQERKQGLRELTPRGLSIIDILSVLGFFVFAVLPFAALFLFFTSHQQSAFATLIVWLVMVGCVAAIIQKNKGKQFQAEQDRISERTRSGLAVRDSSYKPANASEWKQAWNWRRGVEIDWLEDQVQELQSGDIVLSFSKGSGLACWAGYAVERDGMIVAIATTYIS